MPLEIHRQNSFIRINKTTIDNMPIANFLKNIWEECKNHGKYFYLGKSIMLLTLCNPEYI
jgi:hypothetical protein